MPTETTLCVLLWKHLKERRHRKFHTFWEIFSGFLVFFALFLWRQLLLMEEKLSDSEIDIDVVMYSPVTPVVNRLMSHVATNLNLERHINTPAVELLGFASEQHIIDSLTENQDDSKVFAVLNFQDFATNPSSLNFTVSLVSNEQLLHTNWLSLFFDSNPRAARSNNASITHLKWAIDKSFLEDMFQEHIRPEVSLSAMDLIFPSVLAKVYDFLILCSGLAPLPFFLCNAARLVVERRTGLKELMKLDGVSANTLRLSHLLDTAFMGTIYATLITLILKASSNPILPKSNPFVVGFTIMLHFLSITSLAFITSTLSQDQQHADSFALLVYMLTLLLASQYYNHTKQTPPVIYLASLFLPHHPIYVFWHEVMHFEKRGVGANFENLTESASTMPVLLIWLMHALNTLIIMSFAWYLDLVRPGRWGVAEKWNFLCSRRFWRRHRKRVTFHVTVEKIVHVFRDDRFFEKGPKRKYRDIAIKICEVTKIFNHRKRSEVKALDHVSLEIYKGEITVLLGANGAGKTTLMCVVTGMYSARFGKVYVNGYDTSMRLQEVRRDLSLCPQHNLTFDYLTVRENVMFFARLSIQPKGSFFLTAEYLIAALRLSSRAHKYSHQLSAGMKRCLQVACALASGADVLVMDEPSTGMDVETRRSLWKLLLSLRGKKTVFLSTALMEEAEILGDRIALLDGGHVRCHGSPNFLKRAIGTGMNVTMTLKESEKLNDIKLFVKEKIAGTKITRYNDVTKKVTFKLPLEHEALFPELFQDLERLQKELDIETMEVGMAMEEIFLSFIEHDDMNLESVTSDYEEYMAHDRLRLTGFRLFCERFKVLVLRYVSFLINNKNMFIVLQVMLPIIGIPYLTYMSNIGDAPLTRLANDLSGRYGTAHPTRPAVVYDFKPRDVYQRTLSDEDWKDKFDYEFVESADVRKDMDRLAKGTPKSRSVVGVRMRETNEVHYPVDDIPVALDAINLFSNLYIYFKNPLESRRVMSEYKQLQVFPFSNFIEPKTELQCMAWNTWMFFFINLALAPFIIISVHEYRSGMRFVLFLGGCPPMLHWTVKFVVQLVLFMLIIPTSIVLSAWYLDENDVLNHSDYLISVVVMILLFAMAYLSFSCVLSFFIEEDNALAQVYMMTLCLGVVTPVFMLLLGTIIEYITILEAPYYILLFIAYIVSPHYCFTKGLTVLTEAALHNRICALNKALCPGLAKKYALCCQSNVTTPYLYLDSSGGILATSILSVQFLLYTILLYLLTHRVLQMGYGKFTNLTYVPKLQYHYNHEVKEQKHYVREALKELKGLPAGTILSDDCLIVSNLHKKYFAYCYGKSRNAVRGINFAVKKGECLCIMGANGAGKTSTLNAIVGYTPATRGEMWCNGYFLGNNRSQYIHSLGYMCESGGMDEFLSAIEVLRMRGVLCGRPPHEAEHLALAALRYMGLDKYNQAVRHYSPGCRRRLGIAALLVASPKCVLLDEPSECVDAAARPLVVRALSGLLHRGVSALVAAHSIDWKDLEVFCNKLAVMCRGELALYGTPIQLKANYACGLTARLKLHMEPASKQWKSEADKVETNISRYSRIFDLKMSFQDMFEGAILISEQISVLYYLITSDSNQLIFYELFTKLYEVKATFEDILQDYTLSETSIDELYAMLERFHE